MQFAYFKIRFMQSAYKKVFTKSANRDCLRRDTVDFDKEFLNFENEIYRNSFAPFVKNTVPNYIDGYYLNDYFNQIQQFYNDVLQEKSPRLIINMPPRHLKSETATIRLPLFAMLNNPRFEVIIASANQDLSNKFSRISRDLVAHDYIKKYWKNISVNKKLKSVKEWGLSNGSVLKAVGIGGQTNGYGGHIVILDDPIKSLSEALSKNKKEEQYKHQQIIHNLNLQQQLLLNELNQNELAKTQQEQKLQSAELENQKLQNAENTQKLKITTQEKALAENRNKSMQQENELAKLKLKQFWLYGFIGILIVGLLFFLLWNKNRLKQLKTENKLKEKEAEELLQKNKVTESELKAIRSQMNPHFIFNVLNSIKFYIYENDRDKAINYLDDFSELIRRILESSKIQYISLEEELKILNLYIELEEMMFEQDFNYEIYLDSSLDRQIKIPSMLLQPFVENAFKHGISFQEPSFIKINLQILENRLLFMVTNSAHSLKPILADEQKGGIGLENVKQRLSLLYSGKHELIIRENSKEYFAHLTLTL